jgi:hypothetical protein
MPLAFSMYTLSTADQVPQTHAPIKESYPFMLLIPYLPVHANHNMVMYRFVESTHGLLKVDGYWWVAMRYLRFMYISLWYLIATERFNNNHGT